MLIGAGRGEKETEISLILFTVWATNVVDVDVVMIGSTVVAIAGFEQYGVVVTGARFVSTGEFAHQPAPTSCMVTGRATDICNPNCICCGEYEERVITVELLIPCVPDNKPLLLERREVIYTGEEERVKILGGVGSRDKTSRQNVTFFVAVARGKIIDDPDIDPAIRLLVSEKLGSVGREHQDGVVWFEEWCDVVKIVLALSVVREDIWEIV